MEGKWFSKKFGTGYSLQKRLKGQFRVPTRGNSKHAQENLS